MFFLPCYYEETNLYRVQSNNSYIRILHAVPNGPPVDVYVNNSKVVPNISYSNFSSYIPLASGIYNIKIFPVGKISNPILNQNIAIPASSIFTVAAIGNLNTIGLLPIVEPRRDRILGKTYIRFAHLSPNTPNVDVALRSGKDLFKNISYKGVTEYIPVDPGVYAIEIKTAGTNKRLLYVPNIRAVPNRFLTIYTIGLSDKKPPLQVLIPMDGNTYLE